MSFDLDLKIPIIIGTVPVMENFTPHPPQNNNFPPQNPYPQQVPPPGGIGSNSQIYPQIPGPGAYPPGMPPANYPPQPYPSAPGTGGGMPPPPGAPLGAKAAEAGMGAQPPQYYPPGPQGAPGGHVMPSAPPMPQDAYPDLGKWDWIEFSFLTPQQDQVSSFLLQYAPL